MQLCLDCVSNHEHDKASIYCLALKKLIGKRESRTKNSCPYYQRAPEKAPAAPESDSEPSQDLEEYQEF